MRKRFLGWTGLCLLLLLASYLLRKLDAPTWARTALYLTPALVAALWGRRLAYWRQSLSFGGLFALNALPELLSGNAPWLAALTAVGYAAFFSATFAVFGGALKRLGDQPPLAREKRDGALVFGLFFAFSLLALCLSWSFRYPFQWSRDYQYIWDQITGLIPYSNVHPIGYTLYLKVFQYVFGGVTQALLFGLLLLSLAYAAFALKLYHDGCSPSALMLCLCGVLLCTPTMDVVGHLYKDLPYAVCILVLTLGLAEATDRRGMKPWHAVVYGCALAWTALLRLNGLAVVLPCAVLFAVFIRRYGKALLCFALSAGLCVGSVYAVSRLVLHPVELANGNPVFPFASGIAAVVSSENGSVTEAEQAQIDDIFGDELVEWMRTYYGNGNWMYWTIEYEREIIPEVFEDASMRVFNNRFVVRLGERPLDVVKLYLSLLPHNLGLMLGDVANNTQIVWRALKSGFPYTNMTLTLVLLFAMCALWRKGTWRERWPVLVPIVFNALSILVSTVTNESRYILPTTLCFPMLLGFALTKSGKALPD